MSLLADDEGAFDYGGSGVVDAIQHRLHIFPLLVNRPPITNVIRSKTLRTLS